MMMLFNIPWWIIVIALFIFISGYMAYRANRAERKLDQHFIEKEGSIYVERMQSERERRKGSAS